MGSDNRTATTSKPRPKWRDRHLGQLNAEQLAEVQERRGETDMAGMVGVENPDTRSRPKKKHRENVLEDKVTHKDKFNRDKAHTDKDRRPETQRQPQRHLQRQAGPATDREEHLSEERWPSQQGYLPEHFIDRSYSKQESRNPTDHDQYFDLRQSRDDRDSDRSRASGGKQRPRTDGFESDNRSDMRRGNSEIATARSKDPTRHEERARNWRHQGDDAYRDDENREARRRHAPNDSRAARRSGHQHPPEGWSERSGTRRQPDRKPVYYERNEGVAKQQTAGTAHHQPGDRDTAPTENKTGMFAALANFRLSRPLKYGLMAFAIAAMIAVSFFKPIDNSSQSQLDSALTRATIGFGLARTLNGVISVAQGTEFAVQPAGVGVNFSPGEILDPINDLVERFSWVMLLATSSLGVQKILLEVSSWAGISVLLAGAGLFFLLTRMRNSAIASMADIAAKLLLLMLLVRFLIPLGSIANDWVYKQFLQPHFEHSSEQLEIASDRIREISTRQTNPEKTPGSLTERAKGFYKSMTSKFDFDGMLNDYKQSAENVSENAVNLIVVFLLQTIVFPLLFLYVIYRLFKSLIVPARSRVQ